jgi:hypothetical protein
MPSLERDPDGEDDLVSWWDFDDGLEPDTELTVEPDEVAIFWADDEALLQLGPGRNLLNGSDHPALDDYISEDEAAALERARRSSRVRTKQHLPERGDWNGALAQLRAVLQPRRRHAALRHRHLPTRVRSDLRRLPVRSSPKGGSLLRPQLGLALILPSLFWGCAGVVSTLAAGLQDAGLQAACPQDAGLQDAGLQDAGLQDAGLQDAGLQDAGIQCSVKLNANANVADAVLTADSGATICLNAGNYPAFEATVSKASLTTVTASPGLTAAQVHIEAINVQSSKNLAFVGLTIGAGGSAVGVPAGGAAFHIQFKQNIFTGPLDIFTPENINQDTVVDGNIFANVGGGATEGRLGVRGYDNTTANGVVISNNTFSGPGPSDGVQIIGTPYGTVIGPGNEFKNIKESGCGQIHCDPIQLYGSSHTSIIGNYFHDNSTGLMLGSLSGELIADNVFVTDGEYSDQIVLWSCDNLGNAIRHNTLAGGANIRFISDGCGSTVFERVSDNIVTGSVHADPGLTLSTNALDHNLTSAPLPGSNNLVGQPSFLGGALPGTWGGYALTPTSLGFRDASDGSDRGARSFGSR